MFCEVVQVPVYRQEFYRIESEVQLSAEGTRVHEGKRDIVYGAYHLARREPIAMMVGRRDGAVQLLAGLQATVVR
jgi:hypothetical protein